MNWQEIRPGCYDEGEDGRCTQKDCSLFKVCLSGDRFGLQTDTFSLIKRNPTERDDEGKAAVQQ